MNNLFIFLIQSSVALILFYMVYWLFLRKETYYKANRFFLLFTLLASVLIPLAPLHYTVFVEAGHSSMKVVSGVGNLFKVQPIVDQELNESFNLVWTEGLMIVYLTGTSIFIFRLLFQTAILLGIMKKYKIKSLDGIRIVENEKYGLPFSFFNIVFINPKFHTQDDLPEILAHEKVHIRENHWFDLLFIELLTVIFWFNPFIWFFERSIKQNHEYLADKGVLAQGHGVGHYQALLINQLMGMQIIGVTNNLNFALNANRLKMMTKKKTPRLHGVKFMWALPAIALLLLAFAKPIYEVKEAETVNSISAVQKGEKEFLIKGAVVREDNGKPLPGASVVIKGTTVGTVSDIDGTFTLVDPNPEVNAGTGVLSTRVVISFVGFETMECVISASGTAIDNGKFTFKMEEAVILIKPDTYIGAIPSPPPPKAKSTDEKLLPPPKAKEEKLVTSPPPPPPPPSQKEEEVLYEVEDMPQYPGGHRALLEYVKGEEIIHVVEDMPQYPGGHRALMEYVIKMQEKLSQAKGIKGEAKVAFTVNGKGKVTDIKVVEQDNDGVAKGAVVIVSGMEDWTPGKQYGKPVKVNYVLPIEF